MHRHVEPRQLQVETLNDPSICALMIAMQDRSATWLGSRCRPGRSMRCNSSIHHCQVASRHEQCHYIGCQCKVRPLSPRTGVWRRSKYWFEGQCPAAGRQILDAFALQCRTRPPVDQRCRRQLQSRNLPPQPSSPRCVQHTHMRPSCGCGQL